MTNGALKYDLDLEVAGGQEVTLHFWDAHGANAWWDKWAGEYMKLHPTLTPRSYIILNFSSASL